MAQHRSSAPLDRSAPVLLALVLPVAAYVIASLTADRPPEGGTVDVAGVMAALPWLVGLIGIPSAIPVLMAGGAPMRTGVVMLMTAVAAVAGVLVVTTDDAQAGLAVLWVPMVALPLATALWIGRSIVRRREPAASPPAAHSPGAAAVSDRLAALAVDVTIVGAVLVAPLTAMSHAGLEVPAFLLGIAAATAYFGGSVGVRGRTVGQSLLALGVADAATHGRVGFRRAMLRGFLVVLATVGAFVLPVVAVAELISLAGSGRSLTDKLVGTSVLDARPAGARKH